LYFRSPLGGQIPRGAMTLSPNETSFAFPPNPELAAQGLTLDFFDFIKFYCS
jgi:hypothetical protein